MRRVALIMGTRPEAIKFAPIVRQLRADPRFSPVVVSTGQHREMLDETLDAFGLRPDVDLKVMRPRQTLSQVTYRSLRELERYLASARFDAIMVQGDTATTFAGALSGFHHQIPVVHVEAGLRSGQLSSPFPEEGNRRMIAQVAELHLAPTPANRANLIREGVSVEAIVVTGNTVVDALRWATQRTRPYRDHALRKIEAGDDKVVLASAHRRDAWPQLDQIAKALVEIASQPGVQVVVPLHRNPAVRDAILSILGGHPHITVTDPLPYLDFCRLMRRADIVVSDSSGAQEEGPALGKPTLVLADVSERSEAIVAGTARLVGKTTDRIVAEIIGLLQSEDAYAAMANATNPYGDGHAARRIAAAMAHFFGDGPPPRPFHPATVVDDLEAELARSGTVWDSCPAGHVTCPTESPDQEPS